MYLLVTGHWIPEIALQRAVPAAALVLDGAVNGLGVRIVLVQTLHLRVVDAVRDLQVVGGFVRALRVVMDLHVDLQVLPGSQHVVCGRPEGKIMNKQLK